MDGGGAGKNQVLHGLPEAEFSLHLTGGLCGHLFVSTGWVACGVVDSETADDLVVARGLERA